MTVNERPILFSGSMIRAILAGQKTVTRRVVRWRAQGFGGGRTEPSDHPGAPFYTPQSEHVVTHEHPDGSLCGMPVLCCPAMPGDRLWVRETWYDDAPGDNDPAKVGYRATHDCRTWEAGCPCDGDGDGSLWRPSIHMPRWASRLTLAVTDVRVERLHAITPEDAQREGVEHYWHALNEGAAACGGTPICLLNTEEVARIEAMHAEGLYPEKWSADDPHATELFDRYFADGSVQPLLLGLGVRRGE